MSAKEDGGGNWLPGTRPGLQKWRKCSLFGYRAPLLESRGCRGLGEVGWGGRRTAKPGFLVRGCLGTCKISITETVND